MVDAVGADILAFTHSPMEHWKNIWSDNPEGRASKELRRRTEVNPINRTVG